MKVEQVPMFDVGPSTVTIDERKQQFRKWRNQCPLRGNKLPKHEYHSLSNDPTIAGGWNAVLEMIKDGLLKEIPTPLAERMHKHVHRGIPLDMAVNAWIAKMPPYPWQDTND